MLSNLNCHFGFSHIFYKPSQKRFVTTEKTPNFSAVMLSACTLNDSPLPGKSVGTQAHPRLQAERLYDSQLQILQNKKNSWLTEQLLKFPDLLPGSGSTRARSNQKCSQSSLPRLDRLQRYFRCLVVDELFATLQPLSNKCKKASLSLRK